MSKITLALLGDGAQRVIRAEERRKREESRRAKYARAQRVKELVDGLGRRMKMWREYEAMKKELAELFKMEHTQKGTYALQGERYLTMVELGSHRSVAWRQEFERVASFKEAERILNATEPSPRVTIPEPTLIKRSQRKAG